MFVIFEEPLGERQGDEHELVVVLDLVDGERAGDESMLVQERLVGSQEVDPSRALGGVQVQGTREMRIGAQLRRQPTA